MFDNKAKELEKENTETLLKSVLVDSTYRRPQGSTQQKEFVIISRRNVAIIGLLTALALMLLAFTNPNIISPFQNFSFQPCEPTLNQTSTYVYDCNSQTISNSNNNTLQYCLSPNCILDSSNMLTSMDYSLSPCNDFYSFSCNSWIENNPLQPYQVSTSIFENLYEENMITLVDILLGDFNNQLEKAQYYLPTNDTQINQEEQVFTKMSTLFAGCMNVIAQKKAGLSPLVPYLAQITNLTNNAYDNGTWINQGLADLFVTLEEWGVSHFFQLSLDHNDFQTPQNKTFIMMLLQGGTILNPTEYYFDNDTMTMYTEMIAAQLEIILSDPTVNSTLALQAGSPDYFLQMASDIVYIESIMAYIFQEINYEEFAKITLSDISFISPGFPWSLFINSLLKQGGNLQTYNSYNQITVDSLYFFSLFSDLLQNISPQQLESFLIWHMLIKFLPRLPLKYSFPLQSWSDVINLGGIMASQPWKCLSEAYQVQDMSLAYFFLQRSFPDSSKQHALTMISSIRDSFRGVLNSLDWLDSSTLTEALKKVNYLKVQVGYPDWILNPANLVARYQTMNFSSTDFFNNGIEYSRWLLAYYMKQILNLDDGNEWFMNPAEVNAYYDPTENEMVFPAGILQPPFFSRSGIEYINFGAIGIVMGHELTHGFDNEGRLYDEFGRFRSWWTGETAMLFDEKAQCFVDQYSKYSIVDSENVTYYVNGEQDLGEILADNGGLTDALKAWRSQLQGPNLGLNNLLPVWNMTRTQLMFLSFGQMWCSNSIPDYEVYLIENDVHPPPRFRVNGAVSNNADFSNAFNCPMLSPMNPNQKCQLW